MNKQEAAELLDRLGSREEVGSPPMGDLFQAGRRIRRRRRGVQIAGVAVAVAVVTAGGYALQPDSHIPTATSTTPTATKGDASLVAPDGTRLVGEGAVVVAVPETWTTNDIVCGGVGSDTVTFNNDGPWAACAGGNYQASVLSIVDPSSPQWDTRLRLTAEEVSVDGMSGLRTPTGCTSTPIPTCSGALTFPKEEVSFLVTSPYERLVNEILDSAQRLPAGFVTVPDVQGMAAADAQQTLASRDLLMDPPCTNGECRSYVRWPTFPGAGSAVALGSTVAIGSMSRDRDVSKIQESARAVLGDDYAGLWVDQASGGLVTIGSSVDRPADFALLRGQFPDPEMLQFVVTERSMADLEAVQTEVLGLHFPGSVGLDVTKNVVTFQPTRILSDSQFAELAKFGSALQVSSQVLHEISAPRR